MAKGSASKPTKGKIVKEESSPRIEVGSTPIAEKPDFFKPTMDKNPDFHYHWASDNPRRIHEMKRKGYELDPTSSSEEAAKKSQNQREYLKRQMHDPGTSKENAQMAKELLNRMESAPIDTVTNIPQHVLMRQPMEQRRETMKRRQDIVKSQKAKLDADVRDLNKALQRSGKGGMKAFREMFDSIK
jgi:uncharacterized protein YPO0396